MKMQSETSLLHQWSPTAHLIPQELSRLLPLAEKALTFCEGAVEFFAHILPQWLLPFSCFSFWLRPLHAAKQRASNALQAKESKQLTHAKYVKEVGALRSAFTYATKSAHAAMHQRCPPFTSSISNVC